jgi:hypothetical protein
MATWKQVTEEAPELAALVEAAFRRAKHCTLATTRADGSPRISGTEVEIRDGELRIGSMPDAMKAKDLQRDPRFALHSSTSDPSEGGAWPGESKVAGRAVELPHEGSHLFRLDLTEVVHTRVVRDKLEIQSWHPERGVETRLR